VCTYAMQDDSSCDLASCPRGNLTIQIDDLTPRSTNSAVACDRLILPGLPLSRGFKACGSAPMHTVNEPCAASKASRPRVRASETAGIDGWLWRWSGAARRAPTRYRQLISSETIYRAHSSAEARLSSKGFASQVHTLIQSS